MKSLHLKQINQKIDLNNEIKIIRVENVELYKELYFNLPNSITISKNNSLIDFDKISTVLFSPLDLKINDKKMINFLYKKFESRLDDEARSILSDIELKSIKLLELLSYITGLEITYEHNIDFAKLLASFNVKFDEPKYSNYTELFIRYCKLCREIFKIEIIFSFGITNILTENEMNEINYQLSQNDIDVIDFIFTTKSINNSIIIDDDWCII